LQYFNINVDISVEIKTSLWPERTELVGYWIPGKKQFAVGNALSVLSNSEHASLKIATFSYDKICTYGTATGDRSSDTGVVLRTSWGLWVFFMVYFTSLSV
jgi:hypothetical protein